MTFVRRLRAGLCIRSISGCVRSPSICEVGWWAAVGCGGVVPAILHGPDRIAGDAGRRVSLLHSAPKWGLKQNYLKINNTIN